MSTTQIGVDLAKTVFEIAVSDAPGQVRERKRLTRARLRHFCPECERRSRSIPNVNCKANGAVSKTRI